MPACVEARELVSDTKVRTLVWDGLGEFVDELEVCLAALDNALNEVYFQGATAQRSPMLASA